MLRNYEAEDAERTEELFAICTRLVEDAEPSDGSTPRVRVRRDLMNQMSALLAAHAGNPGSERRF